LIAAFNDTYMKLNEEAESQLKFAFSRITLEYSRYARDRKLFLEIVRAALIRVHVLSLFTAFVLVAATHSGRLP